MVLALDSERSGSPKEGGSGALGEAEVVEFCFPEMWISGSSCGVWVGGWRVLLVSLVAVPCRFSISRCNRPLLPSPKPPALDPLNPPTHTPWNSILSVSGYAPDATPSWGFPKDACALLGPPVAPCVAFIESFLQGGDKRVTRVGESIRWFQRDVDVLRLFYVTCWVAARIDGTKCVAIRSHPPLRSLLRPCT